MHLVPNTAHIPQVRGDLTVIRDAGLRYIANTRLRYWYLNVSKSGLISRPTEFLIERICT